MPGAINLNSNLNPNNMKKKIKFLLSSILLLMVLSCTTEEKHFEATIESLQQYETPEWFRDAKFGIWNVWGPYAVPGVGEWYGRNLYIMESERAWQVQGPYHREHWGHQSEIGYKDFIPMWKAEDFDAMDLMMKYKKAGAKYYSSIATFHDNFDCFDSKHTRWNSVNMGPHIDVVKEFQEAAHAQGLRYGSTTHLARSLDWWIVNKGTEDEPYDGVDPEYYDLYHPPYDPSNPEHQHIADEWASMWNRRIKDLIENYELDLLYFDGGIPFGEKGLDVVASFYNNNLERHDGKENGVMCIKHWPKREGEEFPGVALMDYERKKAGELKAEPWQTDDHIGSWGYNQFASYRSADYVVDKLIDIVSKNGNLLLCIPLKADGTHPEGVEDFLEDMGAWMDRYGEAIYGTRPWKIFGEGPFRKDAASHSDMANEDTFDARDIRFTTKGDDLYVLQLGWPESGELKVDALGLSSEHNCSKIKSVSLPGRAKELEFEQTDDCLKVRLPEGEYNEIAYAVKVVFSM